MRTIALRFNDPAGSFEGAIEQHKDIIAARGSVWWGKRGKDISQESRAVVLSNTPAVILLTHSNKPDRWWGYVTEITDESPDVRLIPEMYGDECAQFGCWFRLNRIERAPKDALRQSVVVSTGKTLSESLVHNPNPYYVIDYSGPRPSIYWE